ncbi:MAG: iron ABC transporter permease [Candidatus Methanomethylophilaceae archaeon]|nr:iron ABC transporter permease [Candidatus Methanomethylophilaceae archaeon]
MRITEFVSKAVDEWAEGASQESADEAVSDYTRYISRKILFIIACIALTMIVVGLSITVGAYEIGFFEAYETIFNHIFGTIQDETMDGVVINMRLPRIVTGIIAGSGLAICGAAMQGALMNPLADPYTTGVSSGAGFGATIAIVSGIELVAGQYGLIINAFVFSLIPTAVIIFVGKVRSASPTVMIMAGIAIMYLFNAASTLLQLWADPSALQAIYRWTVGSLANTTWETIPLMLAVTLAGVASLQLLSGKVNLLSAGDETAKTMGVNADRLRIILMILVAIVTAVIVSFTGLIGFVGLVAPHIVRLFIGSDNRFLFLGSAIFGAALLVTADVVGRTIIAPAILQVGVVTAFLGGPLLLWLVVRKKGVLRRGSRSKAYASDTGTSPSSMGLT